MGGRALGRRAGIAHSGMARDFVDFGEGVLVRYVVALAAALLGAIAGILPAEARRVALVIGNAEYRIGPLANPVHDAAAVAETLEKRLKFDTVLLRPNLSLDGFRAALREMAAQSRGAELGVVFFAGHGIETGGRNYLIPTDAALAVSADIELEAIALDTVLRQLEGVTRLRLVILDACRHNPFPAATRGVRGLVRIEPDLGTLVAYAAKDGTVADDGKGRHSPFTAALLKRIVAPGLDVRRVFGYVSEDVMAATARRQEPYLYGRLGGDEVYLNPQAPTGPAPKPPPQSSEAERAWAAVKDSTSIAVLEAFRRQYGASNAFYDRLAEVRINELKAQQLALLKAQEDKRRAEEEKRRAEADLRPGRVFRDCDACPEMVVMPAGSFLMGSPPGEAGRNADEGPQRRVTIARPFAVGKFEVTRGEFATFVRESGRSIGDRCDTGEGGLWLERAGGSFRNPRYAQDDRHPAVCVSWEDATAFVAWVSRKTGKAYRLLTEAEWEYAARAGTTTRYHFGDGERDLCTYGNVADLTAKGKYKRVDWTIANCRDGYLNTAPVGSFRSNAFGLHDLHGNVLEWVQDCWNDNYSGAPSDGSAWSTGDCSRRVRRGGSWAYGFPEVLRSASRYAGSPDDRFDDIGFRVGRTF